MTLREHRAHDHVRVARARDAVCRGHEPVREQARVTRVRDAPVAHDLRNRDGAARTGSRRATGDDVNTVRGPYIQTYRQIAFCCDIKSNFVRVDLC